MRWVVIACGLVAAVVADEGSARARPRAPRSVRICAKADLIPHRATPNGDKTPPSRADLRAVHVSRNSLLGGCPLDRGGLLFEFAPGVDDRTRPTDMGVRLRVIDGEPPRGLVLPEHPVRLWNSQWLSFVWEEHGQFMPFTFVVEARLVDEAGNLGPARLITVQGWFAMFQWVGDLAIAVAIAATLFALTIVVTRWRRRAYAYA